MRAAGTSLCIGVAIFLSNACGTSPKVTFYTLASTTALRPAIGDVEHNVRTRVAVGPVKVPEMVDRPQFVVRQSSNRVDVLEQHRWAQSLRTEIARVIAADLQGQLRDVQVASSSEYAGRHADYSIAIDIEQFDAVPGQGVIVQAVWTIRRTTGLILQSARTLVREPVHGSDIEQLAVAYGQALAAISVRIGQAAQSLQPNISQ
jgi:uncharacterized protein